MEERDGKCFSNISVALLSPGIPYEGSLELRLFQTEQIGKAMSFRWRLVSAVDSRVLAERQVRFSMKWKSWARLQLEHVLWAPLYLLGAEDAQKVNLPVISFIPSEPAFLILELPCDIYASAPAQLVLSASLQGWRYWFFEWRALTFVVFVGSVWGFQLMAGTIFLVAYYSMRPSNVNTSPHGDWS